MKAKRGDDGASSDSKLLHHARLRPRFLRRWRSGTQASTFSWPCGSAAIGRRSAH